MTKHTEAEYIAILRTMPKDQRRFAARIVWFDHVDDHPSGLPRLYKIALNYTEDDLQRTLPREIREAALVRCGYTPRQAANRLRTKELTRPRPKTYTRPTFNV